MIDKEPWAETDRDIDDSFGFVSNLSHDPLLLPYARRLCLRPKTKDNRTPRFKEPAEISYLEDSDALLHQIANGRHILTTARLSDLFCPYLDDLSRGREGWEDHLSIVIGDDVADRLLFWNAQHHYEALGPFGDMPILRLSPKRFENGAQTGWCIGFA